MKELNDIIKFSGQRLEANLIRLKNIEKLEFNWNGYNAKPIPKEIIEKVKEVIIKLGNDKQPEIFPTGRETIQIQYEYRKKKLYFELENNVSIPKAKEIREMYIEFEFFKERIKCLICTNTISGGNNVTSFEGSISKDKMYLEINKLFEKYPDYYNGQDIKMVININGPYNY